MGQRVLIAGMGFLGYALARDLVAEGHQVWGIKRHPEDDQVSSVKQEQLTVIGADLTRLETLQGRLPAVDVVLYMPSPSERSAAGYTSIFCQGLENLLACYPQAMHRWIFVSSTSVYGQQDGEWVDETTPLKPDSPTAQVLLRAETLLLKSHQPATIMRCGGLYGPGRGRLIERIRWGEELLDPRGDQYTNRIHRDDAAACARHLLGLGTVDEVYNVVDCEPAPRNEVIRWFCRELQVAEPAVKDAAQARKPRSNKRVRNQRLLASGFQFQYPTYREGYRPILADLKASSLKGDN
jgi:nucleoside-diphosphate-sugar epimerase